MSVNNRKFNINDYIYLEKRRLDDGELVLEGTCHELCSIQDIQRKAECEGINAINIEKFHDKFQDIYRFTGDIKVEEDE